MEIPSSQTGSPIRVDAEVLENVSLGPDQAKLVLAVPGWPGAEPGQFVMLSAGPQRGVAVTDPLLPRPMAVYRTRVGGEGPRIEILLRVAGRGTGLIAGARPGERLRVVGPLGRAFPEPRSGARSVLVGGGTGIASLFELAAGAPPDADVRVILGARSEAELLGRADFEALERPLTLTTEDGSAGVEGRVTDALGPLLDAGGVDCVYACGPTPMMYACWKQAERAGVACWVSLENNMACGFGVCLGCAAPLAAGGFALVCRDGPIFDAAQVDWKGLP